MLRNREIRQFAILFCLIAAVAVTIGFMLSKGAGILVLFSAIAFGAVFFVFTRERYKSIARISEQIDRVLHNEDCLSIEEAEEGELAILQSEITKMTLRIREQNDALKKEKKHLADSLADIAHQLRTPLTSANIILSLLANSPDERERKRLRLSAGTICYLPRYPSMIMAQVLKEGICPVSLTGFTAEKVKTHRGMGSGWLSVR